jgi:hypothetical protein
MARTVDYFTPGMGEAKTTTFPQPGRSSDASGARPYLAFDAATDEEIYFTLRAPQALTAPLTAIIDYMMASATANAVRWGVSIEAVTDGDATDLDAVESLATENTVDVTVPGTAGHLDQASVTLTNNDSIAVGDYVRIRVRRVGSNAADTATGDALFLGMELRDAA